MLLLGLLAGGAYFAAHALHRQALSVTTTPARFRHVHTGMSRAAVQRALGGEGLSARHLPQARELLSHAFGAQPRGATCALYVDVPHLQAFRVCYRRGRVVATAHRSVSSWTGGIG
ncbi:MAG: hypothetical protein U0Y82_01135 [Thermoleophilia bacterium]